ncbi:MAG: hypothetical protein RBS05_05720 [Zoogloea oleivorans]|uniref:hypothetical protein n=1 Tax=Zoogloea oleivorans TaxID=1552750 RepID=UPI002A35BA42|nr:hypothetical protein [Zoogloea oleivorans]MDY0035394.1 hypothetical protein [Zoogloea oleivorans]
MWVDAKVADRRIKALWVSAAPPADIAPARSEWGVSQVADQSRLISSRLPLLVAIETRRRAVWGVSQIADLVTHLPGSDGLVLVATHVARRAIWGLAETADNRTYSPWGMGRIADSGTSVVVEPGDPNEPDAPVIIPILKAYIVINSASLSRVSNNLALPAFGLSMSIDDRSAHWTWSASLPLAALADIEPDAPGQLVELEAVVNGCVFRLFIQSVREREAFLGSGLAIGGRGLAAELSAPNYPVSAHNNIGGAMTAQQLAAEALSINGVPLGWSLDWQAADWLVPAGVWLHSGTPLDAVVTLAAAAGAYVQADPAARALHVLPRYPVAPWDWSTATPAVVLPASAVLDRGTEHVIGAGYNVVYVSGQEQGIRARVKRLGTAGDVAAEMIVDRLITHADAARGRGLEVLARSGARQVTTLETGVLPVSGLLHVGTLMDWTRGGVARRGLVRSLRVSVSVPSGQSRDPIKVRQTVEVETRG